jgi:DNA-binding transcriptional LysR family regulator
MDTNFEHYKVFYYVAKYGNLTKAAAVLKTSQPGKRNHLYQCN